MQTNPHRLTVRKSEDRGRANHGWLDARHSFSFADYYDPDHMGFRSLRVINQDLIAPGAGFPAHPHRDMEIFTYVLEGALQHRDSMGNGRVLRPGQIQLMSAGSGITHSEFNPLADQRLHLLQIWIHPHTLGLEPSYTEWQPAAEAENLPKVLIISPDGADGSALIRQDARVYRLKLGAGESSTHDPREGRGLWLQVIAGTIRVDSETVAGPGDAVSTEDAATLTLAAETPAEALLFDLA
ncbi:MAG: pirin family protein [Verrucomicrobiae bacterium]|nr:pirin family protein [Verrucomicrobiae bacterium]